MALIDVAFQKTAEIIEAGRNQIEEAQEGVYGQPSDEPIKWERDGLTRGVMSLDVPKMGVQLMAGWTCQKIVPLILSSKLDQTVSAVELWIGKNAGRRALPKFGWVTSLLNELAVIWFQSGIEKIIETKIREKSLELRREMLSLRLGSGKPRKVATCRVYSRKKTKGQRFRNESWTDRKN